MIDLRKILSTHECVEESGSCLRGVRDLQVLEGAIANTVYYDSELDKVLSIVFTIVCNHVFNDGNKRTGFLVLRECSVDLGIEFNSSKVADVILDAASCTPTKKVFFENMKGALLDSTTQVAEALRILGQADISTIDVDSISKMLESVDSETRIRIKAIYKSWRYPD